MRDAKKERKGEEMKGEERRGNERRGNERIGKGMWLSPMNCVMLPLTTSNVSDPEPIKNDGKHWAKHIPHLIV